MTIFDQSRPGVSMARIIIVECVMLCGIAFGLMVL